MILIRKHGIRNVYMPIAAYSYEWGGKELTLLSENKNDTNFAINPYNIDSLDISYDKPLSQIQQFMF